MRAWLIGALGPALLLGCGPQTSSNAHQTVSNAQQIARAAAGKAQAGTPESKTLEITGYDQTIAPDDDEEPPVAILCDPDKFRLSIRLGNRESLDRSFPARATIPLATLIQPLPAYYGDMQYRGELTHYAQCGPYTIRLVGDFYNSNREGELGAYPSFATVQVSSDNRIIAPRDGPVLAIGMCERINRRGPKCPGAWATRIDLDYESKREKVAIVEQTWSNYSLQGDGSTNRERSERRYESQHSLSMWESRRDDRKQKAARPAQPASGTP